jgi:hypothetical protein
VIQNEMTDLSEREIRQLAWLYAVYKRPTIAGIWNRRECETLAMRGLAERSRLSPEVIFYTISQRAVSLMEGTAT